MIFSSLRTRNCTSSINHMKEGQWRPRTCLTLGKAHNGWRVTEAETMCGFTCTSGKYAFRRLELGYRVKKNMILAFFKWPGLRPSWMCFGVKEKDILKHQLTLWADGTSTNMGNTCKTHQTFSKSCRKHQPYRVTWDCGSRDPPSTQGKQPLWQKAEWWCGGSLSPSTKTTRRLSWIYLQSQANAGLSEMTAFLDEEAIKGKWLKLSGFCYYKTMKL